jgi:uncharacterized protein with beta-barrel porin domain
MLRFGKATLSPYVLYTHGRTTVDGYAETGSAFPIQFNRSRARFEESRLGSVVTAPLGKAFTLKASSEWIHRLGQDRATLGGTIVGVGGFSILAPGRARNWGRTGLDLDIGLGRAALLTLSSHAMLGKGEDARLSGSVGVRIAF